VLWVIAFCLEEIFGLESYAGAFALGIFGCSYLEHAILRASKADEGLGFSQ